MVLHKLIASNMQQTKILENSNWSIVPKSESADRRMQPEGDN
jgi:hypothetical protein